MTLTWIYKSYNELTTPELYAILALRNEVFVIEQHCIYQDVDFKDQESFHLMAFAGNDLSAYCRLVKPGISFKEASIGRVITSPRYRGQGIGITLMEKAISHTQQSYATTQVKIAAQFYLKKFYEGFGFVQAGEVYLEDGIEHVDMLRG